MRNGTMFGSLGKYLDESYAKKHNEIYVFTESNTKTYEVFAVYTTINGSNTYTMRFSNTENFIKYKIICQRKVILILEWTQIITKGY